MTQFLQSRLITNEMSSSLGKPVEIIMFGRDMEIRINWAGSLGFMLYYGPISAETSSAKKTKAYLWIHLAKSILGTIFYVLW